MLELNNGEADCSSGDAENRLAHSPPTLNDDCPILLMRVVAWRLLPRLTRKRPARLLGPSSQLRQKYASAGCSSNFPPNDNPRNYGLDDARDGSRQVFRNAPNNFRPRQTSLLLQRRQYIGANRALKLMWREFFVGSRADPGVRCPPTAALAKPLEQFAQAAAQEAARSAVRSASARYTSVWAVRNILLHYVIW